MGLVLSAALHFSASGPLSWTALDQKLTAVQQRSYAELDSARLELGSFSEADSFFQSSFEPLSLLGPRPVYRIEVNPRLLALDCPPEALEAVLAHELAHTLDYRQGGPLGVLAIGWQLLLDPASYERRTDLQAIFRGYGPGLIRYREWLYRQLTPAQISRKRRIYFSPEEIGLILQRLDGLSFAEFEQLRARWLAQPPLTMAQLQAG
ncbi:MAG: hypothetical protein ACAI44_02205 [Candidatus Sericytochromatia bacterium]